MTQNQYNEKDMLAVITESNILLAEYHIYYQKLRNFHWNVSGHNFFELHSTFENLYNDARVKIDEIAERILTLKYYPITKFSDYLQISKIEEVGRLKKDTEMVNALLHDHDILLAQMKKVVKVATEANDDGTIDLLGGYIRELEKASWMLRAWSKQDLPSETELAQ